MSPRRPCVPSALALCTLLSTSPLLAVDTDGDGVDDAVDVCCNTPPATAVDAEGRPVADLDADCDGDLDDYALFLTGFTGALPACGVEVCDGLDNDCNCLIDDNPVDAPLWYYDFDGDGWGIFLETAQACTQPAEYGPFCCDCDVSNPAVNPGAAESCTDGIDNNCDGLTDCEDEAICPFGATCGPSMICGEFLTCACDNSGVGNCDGNLANGCETNTNTSSSHCGACNSPCSPRPNAVTFCANGSCSVFCNFGFANCNGQNADGCEADLFNAPTTCATAPNIGPVNGNDCNFLPTISDHGSHWYSLQITDVVNGFDNETLSIDIQLNVPFDMNYDLILHRPCGNLAEVSSQPTGQPENIGFTWSDSNFSNNTRIYIIEVRYFTGSSCSNYELHVNGGC